MSDNAAPADDADDYEDDPEEPEEPAAPGLAVTALAGATGAAAAYYAGGAGGAALFTAATPFLAVVFQKTVNAIVGDKSRRADKMLETAAGSAGLSLEQLADRAGESEQTRFLTDKAIQAAADTIWPAGVRAIGRAYAAGLLAKDKPVLDIRLRVLGIMEDLDEMHVRLLDLLVRYEPEMRHDGPHAIPQRVPSYVDMGAASGNPDNPVGWSIGRRKWTAKQIVAIVPDLGQVLASLLGELRESGLVQENDTSPGALKRLSQDLTKQVNSQAGQMQRSRKVEPIKLQEPRVWPVDATWSPTELGEKVLAFYAEAAAEDSQDAGG